jgi:hypothetical protein
MVFTAFGSEVGNWGRQMGLDAKMVATCCGQPGSSADTASYVGKRYATSQVAAANNGDSSLIPAIRCDFHRENVLWFVASHCATVVFSEFEGSVHRAVQGDGFGFARRLQVLIAARHQAVNGLK